MEIKCEVVTTTAHVGAQIMIDIEGYDPDEILNDIGVEAAVCYFGERDIVAKIDIDDLLEAICGEHSLDEIADFVAQKREDEEDAI